MPAVSIPNTPKESGKVPVNKPQEQVSVVKEVFADETPWYLNNAIDSTPNPIDTLFSELSGYPFVGTFYGQMNDTNESLSSFQLNQLAIYQQYRRVDRLELLISSPASFSSEDEISEVSYTLTALLYANGYLKPLQGDLFVADIADGRAGIFHISEPPKPLSIFKNAAYEIQLALHSFVYDSTEIIDAIESKVVDRLVFFKEYLDNGKDPFFKKESLVKLGNLRKELDLLERAYIRRYYNRLLQTLTYSFRREDKTKWEILYDLNLVGFVSKILRLDHQVSLGRLHHQQGSNVEQTDDQTLFDLIKHRNSDFYSDLIVKVNSQPNDITTGAASLGGIHYSSVNYYVINKERLDGSGVGYMEAFNQQGNQNSPSQYGLYVNYSFSNPTPIADQLGLTFDVVEAPVAFYPVEYDGHYILSSNFYNKNQAGYSTIESALMDYLSMEPVDLGKLQTLLEASKTINGLDGFYLIPIILFLGRTAELTLN